MSGPLDPLASLVPHLEAWWGTIGTIAALIGLALAVKGLAGLAGRPDGRRRGAFLALVSGILLLNLPELLDVLSGTILGRDSAEVLSYRPPDHPAAGLMRLVFLAVALVGLIGTARGVYILGLPGGEGGGLPRALVHLAGGILCLNLPEFLRLLAASLGGEVEALVAAIVGG